MKLSKAEVEAIIEAAPRTFVPFNQLILSQSYQARTGATPKMSIGELAASIQASGVLQNLIVVKGPRNAYEVCAGGRRLEALGLLVAAGDLADNYPVSLPAPKTRPVHSERLLRSLSAHRVAAIQAELLDRPDVATAVLTAQLAVRLLSIGLHYTYGGDEPLTLNATDIHAGLRSDAEDIEAGAAWQAVEAARKGWLAQLPQEDDAVLPWVLRQDAATVARLLTFLVAITVTGVYGTEPEAQRTDGLALALDLDMRQWWQATAASYFSHVSKARIAEVVAEAVGAQAAAALQALKKEGAASGAEKAVAAAGWLPTILRSPMDQPRDRPAEATAGSADLSRDDSLNHRDEQEGSREAAADEAQVQAA